MTHNNYIQKAHLILKAMLDIRMVDHILSLEIRGRYKIGGVEIRIAKLKWKWAEHLTRRDVNQ